MDKESGVTKFVKTITISEDCAAKNYNNTCNYMGTVSHSIAVRVEEIYKGTDKIYLVSPFLGNSYKALSELSEVLDES